MRKLVAFYFTLMFLALAFTACSKGADEHASEAPSSAPSEKNTEQAKPQPAEGSAPEPVIEPPVTLEQIEKAGYMKIEQKGLFQISGAIDAWAGKWGEDITEIYIYETPELVNAKFFAEYIQEGNSAGWIDSCEHKNIFMISRSEEPCKALKAL